MSGLEVLGGISAIIALIDASIKIFDGTRSDIVLPETFETMRTRLPIISNILETCKSDLEPVKDSVPVSLGEALKTQICACEKKATMLKEIFEKIISGESDTWRERQFKVIRRLGKGNKVNELIVAITEDVQVIVNSHMLRSTRLHRNCDLANATKEPQQEIPGLLGSFGLCLGQAPYITSDLFIGREQELDAMEKELNPGNGLRKQRRLVVGGIGGIGKTQLAVTYAERHAKLYKSIFWLNAASETMLGASFRSIAKLVFDMKTPELVGADEILARVHRWLSAMGNEHWLLIFDNYDDTSQFEIERYYPLTSQGTIIVTTRRPDLVAGKMIRIKPIPKIEDSLAILQTRSLRENVLSGMLLIELFRVIISIMTIIY